MRVNRQVYGWPEVGNSDAHTLHTIGRGCTWFEGTTAMDVRGSIESGLSIPGGKLWRRYYYGRPARHHINKRLGAHPPPPARYKHQCNFTNQLSHRSC